MAELGLESERDARSGTTPMDGARLAVRGRGEVHAAGPLGWGRGKCRCWAGPRGKEKRKELLGRALREEKKRPARLGLAGEREERGKRKRE
jgi:hypothetical protein